MNWVDRFRTADSLEQIGQLLFDAMAAFGVRYVACTSHVDPLNPPAGAVALINYPTDWLERFSERRYAERDPIFLAARASIAPFSWDEVIKQAKLDREQKQILGEARTVGLAKGVTIPIHAPQASPASCSLVPGSDGIDPLLLPDLHFLAVNAHERARVIAGAAKRRPVTLSRRQRQCLTLAAAAKNEKMIARVLGISPRTVHHTLELAKARYGVSHRVQAVMRAVIDGEITMDEIRAAEVGARPR